MNPLRTKGVWNWDTASRRNEANIHMSEHIRMEAFDPKLDN